MRLDSAPQKLGASAPDFSLPATDGTVTSLADIAGPRATLVAFVCNHCPFVVHIAAGLAAFARDYQSRGVGIAAISANDIVSHPADSPEQMTVFAARYGFGFPYLYDESQAVAKAYNAVCTPDLFLYDGAATLAYAGQFDDARPGNAHPVTGASLRAATDAILAGEAVPEPQRPSVGCSIKWKPGNAP